MKKLIFPIIFILMTSITNAQDVSHSVFFKSLFEKILSNPDLETATYSFYAIDCKTGEIIADFNGNKTIVPASNTKIFSTAAALDSYGGDYRHQTQIVYNGNIDQKGKLKGNIIIKGGGDPTLGSRFFTSAPNYNYIKIIQDSIKALGIKTIEGDIIADASFYDYDMVPPTWNWGDLGNYYGAVPSGLTVMDNSLELHFQTFSENQPSKLLYTYPKIEDFKLDNYILVNPNTKKETTECFGEPYSNIRSIRGYLPIYQKDIMVRTTLPNPPQFLAKQLTDSLEKINITVLGQATTSQKNNHYLLEDSICKPICTIYSPTLKEIIQKTNTFSVNLFAEHCLSLFAKKNAWSTRPQEAGYALMDFWKKKGMDIKGLSLNDGSGLSRNNLISAKQLCFVLKYMYNSPNYKDFNNSLTMCGGIGTMSGMCAKTAAWKNARGKSGTIRRVKSYSGYVKSKSGREIAFAGILNNFTCSSSEAKNEIEKFIVALANYNK